MSFKYMVKTLLAGRTEGTAGKFDRMTFVVPLLLAEDSTVVEKTGKFEVVIEI